MRDRQWEREGMHGKCSGKVASLPTGNDTALKYIIGFKPFFMMKK